METQKNYNVVSWMVIIAMLTSKTIWAQFTISGEIRPRTEMSHGYKALAEKNQDISTVTTQRSRLNLIYFDDNVKTKIVLQDVRSYGSQPQLVGNEDMAISIHEAWAEVLFLPELSLKIGRQEVIYDDHRIFGSVGWAQQARSHDMAIVKYENKFKIHAGIAHHENGGIKSDYYNGPDLYKDLQFIWANTKLNHLNISLLFLNKGNNKFNVDTFNTQETVYSQTLGTRVIYKKESFSLAGNFYYQNGNKLQAINFGAEATYSISEKFNTTIGYEFISGDDTTTTNKSEAFTPYFGTNHKFNGFMDYFYVNNHLGSIGLNDIYIKGKYSAGKTNYILYGHLFSSATDHISGFDGKMLGVEADLVFSYKISSIVNLSAGYSQMFGTNNLELIKEGGDKSEISNWAWIMITVKPVFFTTKKAEK